MSSKQPLAVLISDLHFSLKNNEIAGFCLRQALEYARKENLHLFVLGDLNDTKAILRSESISLLLNLFDEFNDVLVTVLVGNHDLNNEKVSNTDQHCLNFLRHLVRLVQHPVSLRVRDVLLRCIPYQSSNENFIADLTASNANIALVHQGVIGAHMGEYVVDKTSVDPSKLPNIPVISGHYHMRQKIKNVQYIGNPYMQNFAEANDGEKGFSVLYSDGTTDLVPINTRKFIKIEITEKTTKNDIPNINKEDNVSVTLIGSKLFLSSKKRSDIEDLLGTSKFKLEKLCTDKNSTSFASSRHSKEELFDIIIDTTDNISDTTKVELKNLWKEIIR